MVKKMVDLKTARSAVFYNILVQKTKTRHYMEKRWSIKFETNYLKYDWINIYHRKIKNIHCDKIAEFNYKLLQNLVITGYTLSKWKKNISPLCIYCQENDTPEHMIFSCSRIQNIWNTISLILEVKIKWKHIVLGLAEDVPNSRNIARNNLISIIAYSIYCSWVKCDKSNQSYKFTNIEKSIKRYLDTYKCIFKTSKSMKPWFVYYYKFCSVMFCQYASS